MGQARGVEEGLEQWAHRGARVGLALERALWVPRPEQRLDCVGSRNGADSVGS